MGILKRYVMGEVLRAFTLALLTITIVIVLFMVMIEAARNGLSPREIMNLLPFVVPGSMPYTIPVSLLFAVTVVYGRLAADNEIVAIKTAGLSAWTVLSPALFLGLVLSAGMLYLTRGPIPEANNKVKLVVFKNLEDMFYKVLKKEREFNNPGWPFLIKVRDVEGMVMIEPTFKRRSGGPGNPNTFDTVIQAKKAIMRFDTAHNMVRVTFDRAEVTDQKKDIELIHDTTLEIPIPPENNKFLTDKRIQEKTTAELIAEQADFRLKMTRERKFQAMRTGLFIGTGRINQIDWALVQRSFVDYGTWEMHWNEDEAEKNLRTAMSCGSFFFVLLGAPVGILFARRDFLSAFISCFVPIIILYYPLILLGVNMGKDGQLNPTVALWAGNTLLALLSGFVLPSVMKH